MNLPKDTSFLCASYLAKIKANNLEIDAKDRYTLFKSFGPSRLDLPTYGEIFSQLEHDLHYKSQIEKFTYADFVLGWLAILTVEYVLPKWEVTKNQLPKEFGEVSSAKNIIDLTRKIILKSLEVNESLFDTYADFEMGLNIEEWLTYDVSCVYFSAFYALEVILFGGQNLSHSFSFSNDVFRNRPDFVLEALKAHSAIDRNPPGALISGTGTKPIEFDLQKQINFWEWWLTEAVPQAWELAHKSTDQ